MSAPKFTPGEWRVINNGPHWNNPDITNYNIAWSPDGELVAEHVYEEADARLMAASKDLLEALQAVVAVADRNTDEFNRARAAIASATEQGHE